MHTGKYMPIQYSVTRRGSSSYLFETSDTPDPFVPPHLSAEPKMAADLAAFCSISHQPFWFHHLFVPCVVFLISFCLSNRPTVAVCAAPVSGHQAANSALPLSNRPTRSLCRSCSWPPGCKLSTSSVQPSNCRSLCRSC